MIAVAYWVAKEKMAHIAIKNNFLACVTIIVYIYIFF